MNRKSLIMQDGLADEYKVYRKSERKTFSHFVDKAISELPGDVSSKKIPNALKDPNNPYETLRNKGLIDLSRDTVGTGDCSSDVELNFYSEETSHGQTVKVFSSNHHFKHGKLVSSSTQELLPDLPRDFGNIVDWKRRDDLRSKSDTTFSRPVRKKLTDMLEDIEKEKIIERYQRAADESHRCRSASPMNVCNIRDKDQENYLNMLRSKNIYRKMRPFSLPCFHKASLKCKYPETNKHAPVEYLEKAYIKSSSETSVSSEHFSISSSPEEVSREISIRSENYRRRTSVPSKSKPSRDLFVKPEHTCDKAIPKKLDRYKLPKSSRRRTVQTFTPSPKSKYRMQKTSIEEGKQDQITRDFRTPSIKDVQKRLMKPPVYDLKMRKEKESKLSAHNNIIRDEYDKNGSKHRKTKHFEACKDESRYVKNQVRESSIDRGIKHNKYTDKSSYREVKCGIKERPTRKFFRRMEREISATTTEESDGGSQTSGSEIERGANKQNDRPSGSKTSVCSLYYDEKYEYSKSRNPNNLKLQEYHKSRRNERRCKTDRQKNIYEVYNAHVTLMNREAKNLKNEHKKQKEQTYEEKLSKKENQINKNKTAHVTFADEKDFSKKPPVKCSSKKSYDSTLRHYLDNDPCELSYTEEPLEDFLKRITFREQKICMPLLKYRVNNEALEKYREKYAMYSTIPHWRKSARKTEQKNYDYKLSIDNKEYYSESSLEEDCEACAIERLLAD